MTHSADQWSLGATLAWLITGKIMQELGAGRDLPVILRDLVFKATEKQPEDRFGDLREFRDALESAVSGPAASAPPRPPMRSVLQQTVIPDAITAADIEGQCWKCSRVNRGEGKFCAGCGEVTREACLNVKCQQPIGVWERFCPECGEDQPRQRELRSRRVHEYSDLIRRHLQQLDSQYTTPRLRLLLAPVKGLETEAQQRQQRAEESLRLKSPFSGDVAKATQVALARWLEVPEEWTNSVGMKFRTIQAGTYKKMTLTKPLWLGIHQVTQGQWCR